MNEQQIKDVRWLMQIAYVKAWGSQGNATLRDEWIEVQKRMQDITGVLRYAGKGQFEWI